MRAHSVALFSLFLITGTLHAGCTASQAPAGGAGSGTSGGPSGTSEPGGQTGSAPGLTGIWQDTAASSGDFVNPVTNDSFSMTQGYSAKLKITAEGRYTFVHFSSGVARDCSRVSYTDRSEGVVQFANDQLVLSPSQRSLEVQGCSASGTRTLPTDPITFTATLSPYERIGGERTSKLTLGGIYPLALKLLNPAPAKALHRRVNRSGRPLPPLYPLEAPVSLQG